MAGFLYFKPGQKTVTRQDLVDWGLAYAFSGGCEAGPCLRNTPTGDNGVVFCDSKRQAGRTAKMDMAAQDWRKIPASDVWVGMWKDAVPTPAELARRPQMPGYRVKLARDTEWMIPLVRRFDTVQLTTVSNLPCYMEPDDHGNWHRGGVVEAHAHLWDLTTPIATALVEEYTVQPGAQDHTKTNLSDNDIYNAVVALLRENYVLGPAELVLMRELTDEASTHAAVMAACDWPTFMQWAEEQKKSATPSTEDGSITHAGDADSPPITHPPGAI